MPIIRPTRDEVSDRFPLLGFTVQTGGAPYFELMLTTDPALPREQRSAQNFFSTRGHGPLPAERGEAVFFVPPEVLQRFAGAGKLYYGLATFAEPGRKPDSLRAPAPGSPYVKLQSFSGRGPRRMLISGRQRSGRRGTNGAGYAPAPKEELVWAGDEAQPGSQPIPPQNRNDQPRPEGPSSGLAYDDGFGPMPTPQSETGGVDLVDAGIDGPIEDHLTVGMAYPQARAFTQSPDYPGASSFVEARWKRAYTTPRTVNRVVIHITDGTNQRAIGTARYFQDPMRDYPIDRVDGALQVQESADGTLVKFTSRGKEYDSADGRIHTKNGREHGRTRVPVSAHYIVGQDGEVIQCVRNNDRANHANSANTDSIGIEHCASARYKNPPTQEQYEASARLVCWLCDQYGIPKDRDHILGHSEADPRTSHTDCPNVVWDWDLYMQCIAQCETAIQQGISQPYGAGAPAHALDLPHVVHLPELHIVQEPQRTALLTELVATIGQPMVDRISSISDALGAVVGIGSAAGGALMPLDNIGMGFAFLPGQQLATFGVHGSYEPLLSRLTGPLLVLIVKGGAESFPQTLNGLFFSYQNLTQVGALYNAARKFLGIIAPWPESSGVTVEDLYHYASSLPASQQNYQDMSASQTLQSAYTTPRRGGNGSSSRIQPRAAGAMQRTRPFSGQSFSLNWDEVELIPQPSDFSCWAAAAAMVVGWRDRVSLTPETIGTICNRTTATGLDPAQVQQFANEIGLVAEPPLSYSIEAFRQLLEHNGPLWVGAAVPSLHAIVVTGLYGDGAPDGSDTFVRVSDPWDRVVGSPGAPGAYLDTHTQGTRYILSWADFVREYEAAATNYSSVNLQILHSGGTNGRTPNYSGAAGYAMSVAQHARAASAMSANGSRLPAPPPRRSRSMDAGAVATIAGVVLDQVISNSGDVSWELDQFRGIKHPNDVAPTPSAPFRDATTIRLVDWPKNESFLVDECSAWFTVDFQFNGKSLGNVVISNIGTNDAVGWGLHVRAQIMDDNRVYPPNNCAALRVRLHYRFSASVGSDRIAVTDLHLYGDGTYEQNSRWEQNTFL